MKSAWARWAIGIIVVLAIGYGVYLAMREQPLLVDLGTVERGTMTVDIDEEGVTRVRDIYTVSSPLAGQVDRIVLEEGDRVTTDTVIASIHPLDPPFLDERTRTELQAGVEAARSAVALANVEHQRAVTSLEQAESDYQRASELALSNIVSDRELENARSQVRLAEAQVEATIASINLRLAELATVEARLAQPSDAGDPAGNGDCCVSLRAPIDGIVLDLKVRSEQAVGVGTVIAELGRRDDLEIAVDLLSSDAVRVAPGTPATIRDWGGESDLTAIVRRIDPAAFTRVSALGIEEQRVNVVLDLDHVPDGLGHGYRVVAQLKIWEEEGVLHLPIGALFRSDGDWAVFVADGDRASLRTIAIGQINDTAAQVVGGLDEGDRVVLFPSDVLRDGRLIQDRAAAEG